MAKHQKDRAQSVTHRELRRCAPTNLRVDPLRRKLEGMDQSKERKNGAGKDPDRRVKKTSVSSASQRSSPNHRREDRSLANRDQPINWQFLSKRSGYLKQTRPAFPNS